MGPFWAQTGPKWSQKGEAFWAILYSLGQKRSKMAQNGPRMTEKGVGWRLRACAVSLRANTHPRRAPRDGASPWPPPPFLAILGPFWAILGFFGQFAHLWIGLFWAISAILGHFGHFSDSFGICWNFLGTPAIYFAKISVGKILFLTSQEVKFLTFQNFTDARFGPFSNLAGLSFREN